MAYTAPVDEIAFSLNHLAGLSKFEGHAAFENYDADLLDPILEEAGKLARDVLAPLSPEGDNAGAALTDSGVTAAPGFADA